MDKNEIAKILEEYQDVLALTDWFSAIGRLFMWWIDKMFANILGSLTKGLDYAYEFIDFYNSAKLNDFIDDYKLVFFSLMTLAAAYLGFQIMKGNKELNKIVSSTLFAFSLFVALPWLLGQGTDLLLAGKEALPNNKHQALTIIQENITDLYLIDDAGWTTKNPNPRNNIASMTDVNLLDINESVDMGGFFIDDSPLSEKGKAILSKKLTKIDDNYLVVKPNSHFFTEDQTYYRYSFHPFLMLFQLIGKSLVLGFTIAKTMMMLTSLGILKVITAGTALTDLETGQRNKKLLLKIRNTIVVLYIMLVMLYMYDITMAFITASEMNAFMKAFAIIVLSIMYMDGPDIVEELFGIDAGLKSVSRGLIGFAMGAKTGADLAKGGANLSKKITKTAGGVAKKATTAGGILAGGAKGVLDGFKERASKGAGGGSGNGSPITGDSGSKNSANNAKGSGGSSNGSGASAMNGSSSTTSSDGISSGGGSTGAANAPTSDGVKKAEQSQKKFASRPPGNNAEGLLKGHRSSPKAGSPSIAIGSMPKGVTSARENMNQFAKGREKDSQSLPEKALSTYANTAQKAYDSNLAKKTRKSYDVMKNTTKGGSS
ncbi:hypothetical protein CRD70_14005 [Listeria monocytogenes]|uniref:DUF8208 domain-containing protein n=1 Tax=Listeria monocytogenes TaxID=1639 RepID=A0A823IYN9_LISMN|nr:hypothetical protein [Listeria monocytogenes]EAE5923270.1 hypothetical protein [Listeria monocytogenes]EAG6688897.1 hypothetical protein [Listeria monocytogenes]EAG9355033.1 hypothetical protein [Listeria monocytogenes]EHY61368.1 transmembrane protein [Listeria monocytogenes FSL J1-208]QOF63848.1 hypothetical protein IFI77_14090 [Listeria monocytogenes FSL J1-208]